MELGRSLPPVGNPYWSELVQAAMMTLKRAWSLRLQFRISRRLMEVQEVENHRGQKRMRSLVLRKVGWKDPTKEA